MTEVKSNMSLKLKSVESHFKTIICVIESNTVYGLKEYETCLLPYPISMLSITLFNWPNLMHGFACFRCAELHLYFNFL